MEEDSMQISFWKTTNYFCGIKTNKITQISQNGQKTKKILSKIT